MDTNNKCWRCGGIATTGFDIYYKRQIEKERSQLGAYADDYPNWLLKTSDTLAKGQRVYCAACFKKVYMEQQDAARQSETLRMNAMIEKAIRMLEQQGRDVYIYRDAIAKVSEYAGHSPNKFASSHEALAAIVLIRNGYQIRMQYPIAGYRVDFCLPKLNVLLEIDGYLHKGRKKKDAERDAEIMAAMPSGWQIIRIRTEYLEQNADALVKAIKAVLTERGKRSQGVRV